jgi:hypothetical protein
LNSEPSESGKPASAEDEPVNNDCPDLQSISEDSDDENHRDVELDRDSSWNEESSPFLEPTVEPYSLDTKEWVMYRVEEVLNQVMGRL